MARTWKAGDVGPEAGGQLRVTPGAREAVGASGRCPGRGPWCLTRLSSLPRVLRQVLSAEQPLHPRQEAPAGRGCPKEQVSSVQLRPALRLQAQHEGPCAQAAPPAPRWAPGGCGLPPPGLGSEGPEAGLDLALCAKLPLQPLLSGPARDSHGDRTDRSWMSTGAECKPWRVPRGPCTWPWPSCLLGTEQPAFPTVSPGPQAWRAGAGYRQWPLPQPSRRLLPGAWWVWCSCSASRVKSWLQAPGQLLLDSVQGCLPALGIAPALLCDPGTGTGTQGTCQEGDWECPRL